MLSTFTLIDSLVLFCYFAIVLSLGFYYSTKREKNSNDYFLAGRNAGWIAVGLSVFATNISSEHFVGLAGSGASRGLAVAQFELMAIFILIILGWFIAPIYIKSGVLTMPEFLEKRFDRTSRKFFTTFSLIIYILTKITITLFAGGILLNKIFGINMYTSAILIVLITGIYTVIGGFFTVLRINVFHAVVLITGAAVLTFFGLDKVGGINGLTASLPADYFNMFKPLSDPDFPWTGILFGAPILAFWYWCTDQYIVQNILASKSIDDARRGSLLAGLLKILPVFILVLPGLIAASLYPEINGDEAYPALLTGSVLPAGFKGIVLAGVFAAIMSSMASIFNVTATLVTNDFYKPSRPDASDRELVLVGRLVTIAIVLLAIISIPLTKIIASQVYLYLQGVQGYLSPPIAVVFLFGLITKKATAKAAVYTFIIGEIIGLSRLLTDFLVNTGTVNNAFLTNYSEINFLHFAAFLFVVCSVIMLSVSLLYKEKEDFSVLPLQYLVPDSLKEIRLSFNHLSTIRGYRTNIILSVFIVLIILSLWGLWY